MSASTAAGRPPARRAAFASLVGTTVEYYDFFLYGSAAALIFGPQFFPSFSPVAGTLASFGVFAAGFFARPLGGLVMGHYGDRVGRKSMLVISLLLVGVGTFCIGLLPTYHQIGVWAPILLVTLRLIQGIGVGGEWSGAVLMSVEHAPEGRRGLYGVFPQMGVPAGLLFANLAFLVASSSSAFGDWVWRVPFLLSGVLVFIGLYVRLRVTESPAFAELSSKQSHSKRPLQEVVRGLPRQIVVAGALPIAPIMITYIYATYGLSYMTAKLAIPRSTALMCVLVATALYLVTLPIFGRLCDKFGIRKVFLLSCVWLAAATALFFPLLETRNTALMVLAELLVSIGLSGTYGPVATMVSDLFPTRVRFSGSSLGYQMATLIGGAPAPFLAVAIFSSTGSTSGVTLYMMAAVVISALAGLLLSKVLLAPTPAESAEASSEVGGGAPRPQLAATDA